MLKSKLKFPAKRHKVSAFSLQPSAFACSAFTLIEILVVVVLMSLIILALMTVFNATQNAFRASFRRVVGREGWCTADPTPLVLATYAMQARSVSKFSFPSRHSQP